MFKKLIKMVQNNPGKTTSNEESFIPMDKEERSKNLSADGDILPENTEESVDESYLESAPEVVGYNSIQQQHDMYQIISNYIEPGASIIDFGCARGDFLNFYMERKFYDVDYIGIDMNKALLDAGERIHGFKVGTELIHSDWFNLPDHIKRDWSINIGSSNLRYDASTVDNKTYLRDTINTMLEHCTVATALLLASDVGGTDDGLINWNPGEVLNWSQKEFGNVALDHSFSPDIFTLIIYKR